MAGDGNEPRDELDNDSDIDEAPPDDALPDDPERADIERADTERADDEGDWRDQYLDEQLGEHEGDDDDEHVGPAPTPMGKFRHGSLGVTLGAAMTGLGNVLEPRKKAEAPVVIEHDEPDQSQERIEMHLDRDDPGASVVIIRKWVEEHPEHKPPDE